MSTAVAVATAQTPTIKRLFQLTEFGENHNKLWQIEVWHDQGQGQVRLRTTWGRVGASTQSKEKIGGAGEPDRLIAEKVAKGYREVDLHVPQAAAAVAPAQAAPPVPARDARVEALLAMIFQEAGEQIDRYLACTVDALSQAQIARGRDLLAAIERRHATWQAQPTNTGFAALVEAVRDYYNTIPTRLPRNLRDAGVMQQVVFDLCADFREQETRLDQLEAALATYSPASTRTTTPDLYARLGARLTHLPGSDPACDQIDQFLRSTSRHGYTIRLRDVFEVEIPSERAAFAANSRGTSLVLRLTHGTNNANLRHILHEKGSGSGLRLPRAMSHGWMFGPGIYFANVASKSGQYCQSRHGNPRALFLADVAVGRMYEAREAMGSTAAAPAGYDSVWGQAGKTGSYGSTLLHDEFIVYNQHQQTIRYLVTWDQR